MKLSIVVLVLLLAVHFADSADFWDKVSIGFGYLFGSDRETNHNPENKPKDKCDPCKKYGKRPKSSRDALLDLKPNFTEWECIKNALLPLTATDDKGQKDLLLLALTKEASAKVSDCYPSALTKWWLQTAFVVFVSKYWMHIIAAIVAAALLCIVCWMMVVCITEWSKRSKQEQLEEAKEEEQEEEVVVIEL